MNDIIRVNGVALQLKEPGIDNDDRIGGVEMVNNSTFSGNNQTNIQESTELGESLRELNYDGLDPNTRMSGIDLRSRIHPLQVNAISAFETLIAMGIIPQKCISLTRQIKRNAVSIEGKGRKEMVDTITGKREGDKDMAPGRLKSFFGMGGGGNANGQG